VGVCGAGLDGWCAWVGHRCCQVKAERPSQGLASGAPSLSQGDPQLTAIAEDLSLSNEMGVGEQQARVSGGKRPLLGWI